ncbi:BnaCnng67260D, partial [Brassica napus]
QNAELHVIGTEIIVVILSACKRRALSSKQLSKATKPTNLPESVRLISKSLEEEEKPNLYETEDDKNKVVAVLIRGVHVGGMEEIKKLNDGGKLGEMLKGLPVCESVGACGCCGDPSVLWSTLLALFFPSSRQLCFFILSSSNLPPKHCF